MIIAEVSVIVILWKILAFAIILYHFWNLGTFTYVS